MSDTPTMQRTYSWHVAVLLVFFGVFVKSYLFFFFDYVTDIILLAEYVRDDKEEESSPCGSEELESAHKIIFVSTLVFLLICTVLFILNTILAPVPFWLDRYTEAWNQKYGYYNWRSRIYRYVSIFLLKLAWPLTHMYTKFQILVTPQAEDKHSNVKEMDCLLRGIKYVEQAVENLGQLTILSFFAIQNYFYTPGFEKLVEETWTGIKSFVTFGHHPATLCEKIYGKTVLTALALAVLLAEQKLHGSNLNIRRKLISFTFRVTINLLQITVRLLTLSYFVLSFHTYKYYVAVIHMLVVLTIIIVFERFPSNMSLVRGMTEMFLFAVRVCNSFIFFIHPINRNCTKYMNIENLLFQLLMLAEFLCCVIFKLIDDRIKNDTTGKTRVLFYCCVVSFLLHSLLQIIYYKFFHHNPDNVGPKRDDEGLYLKTRVFYDKKILVIRYNGFHLETEASLKNRELVASNREQVVTSV